MLIKQLQLGSLSRVESQKLRSIVRVEHWSSSTRFLKLWFDDYFESLFRQVLGWWWSVSYKAGDHVRVFDDQIRSRVLVVAQKSLPVGVVVQKSHRALVAVQKSFQVLAVLRKSHLIPGGSYNNLDRVEHLS